ncbi:hypothetical protein DBV15_02435 [Temnothorax longispinosus]|uniref:Uncharacterized protein n=1 Tax=Temnothorax longispinosus TaxID=300112 RepID=A0A4S2L1L0_9HYME|nr:hypothetical protein DBV15_02435 [Temnothorax longispinosus]
MTADEKFLQIVESHIKRYVPKEYGPVSIEIGWGRITLIDIEISFIDRLSLIETNKTSYSSHSPSLRSTSANSVPPSATLAIHPSLAEKSWGSIPRQSRTTIVLNCPWSSAVKDPIESSIIVTVFSRMHILHLLTK